MSLRIALRSLVLAVWGGVFLYFWLMGRLPVYIAVGFRPLVPIAAFVLLALAVLLLFAPLKSRLSGQTAAGGGLPPTKPTFPRRMFEVVQYVLLFVPVIASAIVAPQSYSATTVLNRLGDSAGFFTSDFDPSSDAMDEIDDPTNTQTLDMSRAFPPGASNDLATQIDSSLPLPGEDPMMGTTETDPAAFDPTPYITRDDQGRIVAELTDLWNAAADPAFRKTFENSSVSVLGQLLVPKRLRKNGVTAGNPVVFKIARMMIFCCAADAQPVAMQVEAAAVPEGKDMDWVQLTGRVEFKTQGGEIVPYLRAEKVSPAKAPSEIYLTY